MKRLLVLALSLFASVVVQAACVVTGTFQMVDQRDAACFPTLDETKCQHFITASGKTVGAVNIDVDDAKKYGTKVMSFASERACEGKASCGIYSVQFASEAKCDGKPVADMPGGEYRGLTAMKARQIQEYANRQLEAMTKDGDVRGQKGKGNGKGRLWGNPQ